MNAMPAPPVEEIVYPCSDGLPMADNDTQFRWIAMLEGNLAALFRDRQDVKVGGNMFWYPVEKQTEIRVAPDVYVVFGRPKGDRESYLQWKEDNVPMTVVFEVLSPGNGVVEMIEKQEFYEEYGAEEYYLYDPYLNKLKAFVRHGEVLRRVYKVDGCVSPRLGIRFDLSVAPEMVVRYPDGKPFLRFDELKELQEQAEKRADDAQKLLARAEKRANDAQKLLARIQLLGRKLVQGQASAEERAEYERLLGEGGPTE